MSHIDATIVDTSPNDAFGFWPLIAACVSRKNKAYAETGFCGSLGSLFFFFLRWAFGFLAAVGVVGDFKALPVALGELGSGSGDGRFNGLITAVTRSALSSLSSLVVPASVAPNECGDCPTYAVGLFSTCCWLACCWGAIIDGDLWGGGIIIICCWFC